MSVCQRPLQSEAGETWHLLSYVNHVVYVMIQWDCGGEPRVTDLRRQARASSDEFTGRPRLVDLVAEQKASLCNQFTGGLPLIGRQSNINVKLNYR